MSFKPNIPNLKSSWIIVAAVGFAIMGALVKLGAEKFTSSELVFYRSIFGLSLLLIYIKQQKLSIKTQYIKTHLARGIAGFLALLLFFYAIAHLALATAITLSNTSALFLGVLTPLFLHEKQSAHTYIALVIGFIGVSLLLEPNINHADFYANLMGLLAGFGAAIAYLCVRKLGKLNEPDWRTVFYFTLISTIGATIWMLVEEVHALNLKDVPILLGLGASATIAQLAMTRAYRTGNTLVVACLGYSTPLLASLIGFVLWGESLKPIHWLGILLIIGSGVAINLIQNRQKNN